MARIMRGKDQEVREFLYGMEENRIRHLLENRNRLIINSVEVKTRDGESYNLPFRFVFIDKMKKKGKVIVQETLST
jgi:hypothetical protein